MVVVIICSQIQHDFIPHPLKLQKLETYALLSENCILLEGILFKS